MPVDDLTPLGARTSAYRIMAKFRPNAYMAIEGFEFEFFYFPQKYK